MRMLSKNISHSAVGKKFSSANISDVTENVPVQTQCNWSWLILLLNNWFVYKKLVMKKVIKIFYDTFRGKVVLNYTTSFDMTTECNQIIEDQTTPDALLLAQESAIVRMYLNGTVKDVVGDRANTGYEITKFIYHSLVT